MLEVVGSASNLIESTKVLGQDLGEGADTNMPILARALDPMENLW